MTDEEREMPMEDGDFAYFFEVDSEWSFDDYIATWSRPPHKHIAVHVDFVFETEHDKKVKDLESKIHTLTTELAELKQGEK